MTQSLKQGRVAECVVLAARGTDQIYGENRGRGGSGPDRKGDGGGVVGEVGEKPGLRVRSDGKETSRARAGSWSRMLLSGHVDVWPKQERTNEGLLSTAVPRKQLRDTFSFQERHTKSNL